MDVRALLLKAHGGRSSLGPEAHISLVVAADRVGVDGAEVITTPVKGRVLCASHVVIAGALVEVLGLAGLVEAGAEGAVVDAP